MAVLLLLLHILLVCLYSSDYLNHVISPLNDCTEPFFDAKQFIHKSHRKSVLH